MYWDQDLKDFETFTAHWIINCRLHGPTKGLLEGPTRQSLPKQLCCHPCGAVCGPGVCHASFCPAQS